MDINQSSLLGLKPNKSNTSKVKPEARSISDTGRLKETTRANNSSINQDIARMDWKEGQVIKGEIIDLRYNGVSIQLEPSKQVITAKLEGDVPLSIGQNAQFLVTEDSSDRLTLKYLPNETKAPTDVTIEKALLASGLPLTQRNRAIVEELLNRRMSVDKQNLQTLVKLSHMIKDVSPLSLVLMQKYHIPMTVENITQFEAYQRGTHQIINDIHTISKNFSDLFHQSDPGQIKEAVAMNGRLLDIINSTPDSNLTNKSPEAPLSSLFVKEDIALLGRTLQQKMETVTAIPPDFKTILLNRVNNGTMPLREVVFLITKLYGSDLELAQKAFAEDVLIATEKSADKFQPLFNTEELLRSQEAKDSMLLTTSQQAQISQGLLPEQSTSSEQFISPEQSGNSILQIIRSLMEQFSRDHNYNIEMKSVLNSQERSTLLELIKAFPGIENQKSSIMNGTAIINDVLNYVKAGLPLQEENTAKNLLGSSKYLRLLEEAFHQKWTISPEKLAQKDAVTNLFRKIQEDLAQLNDLVKASKETVETIRFQEPIKNLQENLGFMKDLNETFTYLQLPVQLKDQDVHSDLYVFTRKNAHQGTKDGLNVLLHLDMQNLGPINVNIHMYHNVVQANFYLEDETAGELVLNHLNSLTSSLQNKGYSFHAEVKDSYEKPDFSKDFIDQSSQDNYVQRYTFDIRT